MAELVRAGEGIRVFCSFRTEGRLYGIDAAQVREISTQVSVTPVPQAPAAVRGLTSLRSRIYLVIDMRIFLGLKQLECTDSSRLIILKSQLAENLGILVEHTGDIVHVPAAQIEDAPAAAAEYAETRDEKFTGVVAGVCKLEGELMNIIEPARVIEALESSIRC